jgi:hypothetical protein
MAVSGGLHFLGVARFLPSTHRGLGSYKGQLAPVFLPPMLGWQEHLNIALCKTYLSTSTFTIPSVLP